MTKFTCSRSLIKTINNDGPRSKPCDTLVETTYSSKKSVIRKIKYIEKNL